jgi:hypothetical protein
MKPIDKLREILCKVPEIKEDLMELKFWSLVVLKNYFWEKKINLWIDAFYTEFKVCCIDSMFTRDDVQKIIWNPVQERHLRMYFKEQFWGWYRFTPYINMDGWFYIWDNFFTDSDNTKDLQDQEDSVIQSIVDFLESNK